MISKTGTHAIVGIAISKLRIGVSISENIFFNPISVPSSIPNITASI